MYYLGVPREEKLATEHLCLLGATHNVWCSMASAAVVGAAAVGLVAIGAAEVGAPSGVVHGAVRGGVMSGVLYGASVVQQWLAKQCMCSNSWSSNSGCYLCAE